MADTLKLKRGDRGVLVAWMQSKLRDRGYFLGAAGADGIFGKHTETALRSFQRDAQLPQSGMADDDTLAALDIESIQPSFAHVSDYYLKLRLGDDFIFGVVEMCERLGCKADDLLAVMAFETGGTFDPAQKNAAGSTATGLIQFMKSTAIDLGTTTAKLARMTRTEQLVYVERYLRPWRGRIGNLRDLYFAVLNPQSIGSKPSDVMKSGATKWIRGSKYYEQNKGLDLNKDGVITSGEVTKRIEAQAAKAKGKG